MITTKGFEDYTWGWAFVHMLMNDKQYAKKFKKFFLGLATDKTVKRTRASFNLKFVEGEEVLRFFMECMDLEDMDDLRELQTQWYDYITDVLEFTGENALIWEAKTASSLGEKKRARELYEKAFKEDMESPLAKAHFDYAQLLRSTSNKKDRALHLRKAVEKAPLTAEYRFTLGQELSRSSDKDAKAEGEKMVAIAIELDPYITQSILFLDFD
jgi:tetratricopeptide (TPR) repeat protein